jgi:hypothetical protein
MQQLKTLSLITARLRHGFNPYSPRKARKNHDLAIRLLADSLPFAISLKNFVLFAVFVDEMINHPHPGFAP